MFRAWRWLSQYVRRLPRWSRPLFYVLMALLFVAVWILLTLPRALWAVTRGIWFRWFPPPPSRDVSRLGSDDELDVVTETVDDEGRPLKEHQHRRIRRDPRLLPKARPPADIWPRPTRKRVLRASEARRLFALTMRTRNRYIRDLLADEDQLQRLGLPVWRSERELAAALKIKPRRLRHFSIHRDKERVCHYVRFSIPKRNGDQRLILAPKRQLKELQRRLLRDLVDRLPVSDAAHGFRTGRSTRTGADPHIGRALILKLDLKDFFPSVTFARLRGYLIALGYGYPVATALAVLMTESDRQPVEIEQQLFYVPVGARYCVQGAPTSPGLCNSICHRMDRRLSGLARRYDWEYTRYADDLTFSGDTPAALVSIQQFAAQICREEGFELNQAKTRIMRRGRRQRVTGITVNQTAGLSRRERRQLRAVIHRLKHADPDRPATLTASQVEGKLAYLEMLNPDQAAALRESWR